MDYDDLGRKTSMDDPDMGHWAYVYDVVGNMTRQEAHTNGVAADVLCLYYDELNRLTHKAKDSLPAFPCPTSPPTSGSDWRATYVYDTATNGIGQVASIHWSSHSDTFAYDVRGRLDLHTRVLDGRTYEYDPLTYDSLNRPLTVRTQGPASSWETETFTYDHEGPESSTAGADQLLAGITYNARDQMRFFGRAGAVPDTTFNYNGAADNFRLLNIAHGQAWDAFPNFTYTYDDVGNITQLLTYVVDGGNQTDTQTFTYDALNRLDTAVGILAGSVPAYNLDYDYDELGNIQQVVSSAGTTTYAYNSTKPHAVTGLSGAESGTFGYDAQGNMDSRTQDGVTYTQNFDVENRLEVVSTSSGNVSIFGYDPSGQRTFAAHTEPQTTQTITYYPFPNYEEEILRSWECVGPKGSCTWQWVDDATVVRRHYSAGGQAIAVRVSGHPTPANNGLYFTFADHLGSASVLADDAGDAVPGSDTRYLPFGDYRQAPTTNPDLTERGYTGHKHNDSLGLIYMNARFYVPGIGRFASADTIVPDPANPQSFNRFGYVLNNPLLRIDPSGHISCQALGTEKCDESGGGFQDDPEPSMLPENESLLSNAQIVELAVAFDIPPALLWALMNTIQAIDYDAGDVFEDSLLSLLALGSDPGTMHFPFWIPFKIVSPAAKGAFGQHPSPGIAQMQLRRAEETEDWLTDRAIANARYEPMLEILGTSDGTADMVGRLLDPVAASAYIAAHARMLIESELGTDVNVAALSQSDMALIMGQYNYGPRSPSQEPHFNYSSLHYYQVGLYYLTVWENASQ